MVDAILPESIVPRLAYAPELLPDELLYSWVARFYAHRGRPAPRPFLTELFGQPDVRAIFDVPNHLEALVARLPLGMDVSSEQIAARHTLYPYFVAFAPAATRDAVLGAMRGRGRPTAQRLLGLPSFAIQVDRLRFCRSCNHAAMEKGGELYWRRSFQAASTLVCTVHREPLRHSVVPVGHEARRSFVTASTETCPDDASPVVQADDVMLDRLIRLAASGAEIMDCLPQNHEAPRESYRNGMGVLGFAPVDTSGPYRHELFEALRAFWGEVLDLWPGLSFELDKAWPVRLLQNRDRQAHPLHHLLMSTFIASRFLVKHTPPQPFGAGPWRCENPLAEHKGQQVIDDCEIEKEYGVAEWRGRFRCSCGYCYTLLVRDGAIAGPFRQDWGHMVAGYLARCRDEGVKLAVAGERLGITANSVSILAKKYGVHFGKPRSTINPAKPRPKKHGGRRKSGKTRPAISTRAHVPVDAASRSGKRDWNELDMRLVADLPGAASRLFARLPPLRVTAKDLAEELGVHISAIANNLHRLPLACPVWRSSIEPSEHWMRRRCDYVCDLLEREGANMPRVTRELLFNLPGVRTRMTEQRENFSDASAKAWHM